jgi:hypothetical protein
MLEEKKPKLIYKWDVGGKQMKWVLYVTLLIETAPVTPAMLLLVHALYCSHMLDADRCMIVLLS